MNADGSGSPGQGLNEPGGVQVGHKMSKPLLNGREEIKVSSIDEIMGMLDWNNSREEQLRGIELAREVKAINAFLQPGKPYGERVWDNCARIVSEKTDEELEQYLLELLGWLEDMNWPGANRILDRLNLFAKDTFFKRVFEKYITYAKALGDEVWESNLRKIEIET